MAALHQTFNRLDRELGASLRTRVAGRRRTARSLAIAAAAMSPVYRVVVVALILWRPTRMRGVRALVAAAFAALIARRMRNQLARPRPGARPEGGMPSRHAAAAVAIAGIVAERRPGLGLPMAVITAVGLTGRISTGDHDPADVLAGALLGGVVAGVVARVSRGRDRGAAPNDVRTPRAPG
jgi:membrane-associated phospholipid phosphatase